MYFWAAPINSQNNHARTCPVHWLRNKYRLSTSTKAFCRRLRNGISDFERVISSCLGHLNGKPILDLCSGAGLRFSTWWRDEGSLYASFVNEVSTVKGMQIIPEATSVLRHAIGYSPLQQDSPLQEILFSLIWVQFQGNPTFNGFYFSEKYHQVLFFFKNRINKFLHSGSTRRVQPELVSLALNKAFNKHSSSKPALRTF